MTLIELLVAVALSSLVLVALNFITKAMYASKSDAETFETEKEIFRVEYLLRNLFLTAVDVVQVTGVPGANPPNGWVRQNFSAPDNGTIEPVAVFKREIRGFAYPDSSRKADTAPGVSGPATSLLRTTGVFYIPPADLSPATGQYRAGTLFLDLGTTEAAGDAAVQPDYNDEIIGNLVSFRTGSIADGGMQISQGTTNRVLGFNVEIVYRRFLPGQINFKKCFLAAGCPGPQAATPTAEYIDVRRIFRIMLLNTDLGPSVLQGAGGRERTLGRIYFFKLISPLGFGLDVN